MNKGNNVLLIWPERDKAFYDFDPIGQIFGEKSLFFPLPLLYVAAALGKEWNYKLVDEGVSHLCDNDIDNADFYLISVNVLQRYSAENTIQRLIPHNKPIIIGGPLISTLDHLFCHSRISKVYGEIEATEASCLDSGLSIAELLASDMRNGAIRNEYHSIGHPDIRQNKLPRYDLVKASGYFNLSMQTSRGCPHHCDFCQQVALYGKHRRKTHQQIIHELDLLLELGQNKTVYITDDNVMGDISTPDKKKEFIELLNSIRIWQERHDYPFDFFTQCSLDIADYEDITELMSKIGLNIMFIGIESIDETALSSVHKQQNLQKDIIAKIRLLQHYGIGIFAGMIIGFDNETNSSVNHQIEFVKQSYIPIVGISILTGFPKTALYRRLQKENRICSDIDALTKSFQTNVITTMHPHDLYDNFLRFTKEIYNPHEYFVRCIAWTKTWNDAYVIPGKRGSLPENMRTQRILRSIFYQAIIAPYRFEYIKYFIKSLICFANNYNKLALALYLGYLFRIANDTTKKLERFVQHLPQKIIDDWNQRFNPNVLMASGNDQKL